MSSTAIVWLRRDLRLHDHPALWTAVHEHDRVLPLFVLDQRMLAGRFASGPRTAFMLGCLRELAGALEQRGGALCVREGRPEDVVPELASEIGAAAVFWTSDVSPFARRRDRAVTEALGAAGHRGAAVPGQLLRRRVAAAHRLGRAVHRLHALLAGPAEARAAHGSPRA